MLNLPADDLTEALRSCLDVDRWVSEVVAQSPFATRSELLAAAREAGTFSASEIDEALGDHPRIGEKHGGTTASAEFSRKEQAALGDDDESVLLQIASGNADYERRFGRVFLIRAAGRTRPEILRELRRRLTLDDETELTTVGSELLDITLLRLEALIEQGRS